MTPLEKLIELCEFGGERHTTGLSSEQIEGFLPKEPKLGEAIDQAYAVHHSLRAEWSDALGLGELALIERLQQDYTNFYSAATINRYVPLGARGPWQVTSHGAVLHDSGGYGMLGFGHSPDHVIDAMSQGWVMSNIMTPSFSQARMADRLKQEVGRARGSCPFERFVCLNSGSESVTVSTRIADVNTLRLTQDGGRHAGKRTKIVALTGAFHGRTSRPAQFSDSCLAKYRENLASFQDLDNLVVVVPGDLGSLQAAFDQADADGVFLEALYFEPVQGEGNPGKAVTRAWYDLARRLTSEHGSLLIADSIQAGIRGYGCLSVIDYPGFEDCEAPDMETYSKALNAGQYPLSVLALTKRAADLYVRGIYGNTMTANPRALEVACAVLDSITDELRTNIRERGTEFVAKLGELVSEFPEAALRAHGTGLLVCLNIHESIPVVGDDGLEQRCRQRGLGVIHGGKNALRFTPHFAITSDELDLIIDVVRDAIRSYAPATVKEARA